MNALLMIKGLENGVTVIYSPISETDKTPPDRLDKGEVMIIAIPERYVSIHIRGKAEIYTSDHVLESESSLVIGGSSEK